MTERLNNAHMSLVELLREQMQLSEIQRQFALGPTRRATLLLNSRLGKTLQLKTVPYLLMPRPDQHAWVEASTSSGEEQAPARHAHAALLILLMQLMSQRETTSVSGKPLVTTSSLMLTVT